MSKVLTITIPSYNVERFLHQTLDSFIDTSIMEDLEVLIVDDGSKDDTAAIAKEYEKRYPDTFRLISKENGGHGSTINRGIIEAKGTYFKVVDGDDWVDTEGFVCLIERLRTCEADYVVTNYKEVQDGTGKITERRYDCLKNSKDIISNLSFAEAADKTLMAMHALVIKTSILKEHEIRLDEHCFYVDVEYVLYPIPYVHTVAYIDTNVYMYRLGQETQSVSMQGYQKHIDNHIHVVLTLAKWLEEYKKSEAAETAKVSYISKRIAQMAGDQVSIFFSYGEKDTDAKAGFIKFDQELKDASEGIYHMLVNESGTVSMLRLLRYHGYKQLVRRSNRENQHVEDK